MNERFQQLKQVKAESKAQGNQAAALAEKAGDGDEIRHGMAEWKAQEEADFELHLQKANQNKAHISASKRNAKEAREAIAVQKRAEAAAQREALAAENDRLEKEGLTKMAKAKALRDRVYAGRHANGQLAVAIRKEVEAKEKEVAPVASPVASSARISMGINGLRLSPPPPPGRPGSPPLAVKRPASAPGSGGLSSAWSSRPQSPGGKATAKVQF